MPARARVCSYESICVCIYVSLYMFGISYPFTNIVLFVPVVIIKKIVVIDSVPPTKVKALGLL